jgi:nicotinamidase/pyrazinamidase
MTFFRAFGAVLGSFIIILSVRMALVAGDKLGESKSILHQLFKNSKGAVAVVVVDPQKTFSQYTGLDGEQGSLAVGGTDQTYVQDLVAFTWVLKNSAKLPVVVSRDHHPQGHISFLSAHTQEGDTQEAIKNRYQALDVVKVINLDSKGEEVLSAYYQKNEDTPTINQDSKPKLLGLTRIYFKDGTYIDQVMWPDHGIQGKSGAQGDEFFPGFDDRFYDDVQVKGTHKNRDSYSAFFDNHSYDGDKKYIQGAATGLEGYLKARGIQTLIIYGLATDFCVKATIQDALKQGFNVVFVEDQSRSVTPWKSQAYEDSVMEMNKDLNLSRIFLRSNTAEVTQAFK